MTALDVTPPGYKASWMFRGYEVGRTYSKGSLMLFQGWTVIANKQTTDYPIPVPVGDPYWVIDETDGNWTTLSPDGTSVTVSHTYTFGHTGFVDGERVYIPDVGPDIWYRVAYADLTDPEYPVFEVSEYFQAESTGWLVRQIPPRLIPAGTILKVSLVHENRSATGVVAADYNYTSSNQDEVPSDGQAHRRLNRTYVQFSKVDASGATSLDAVTVGGHIRVDGVSDWTISDITDGGSYWEYEIAGTGNPADGEHSFEFEYITGLVPQYYLENQGYWTTHPPQHGSATGELVVSGVVTGDSDTAYGIDLLVSPADVSPDWSLVSTMDGATGTERVASSSDLTTEQAQWVAASAEPFAQGEVTTENTTWTPVLDIPLATTSHGRLVVTGKKGDGTEYIVYRADFVAYLDGTFTPTLQETSNINTTHGRRIRAEGSTSGFTVEVKGYSRETWHWQAMSFESAL